MDTEERAIVSRTSKARSFAKPRGQARRWSLSSRRLRWSIVVGSIFAVLTMALSSSIPSPDTWHSEASSGLSTDSTSGGSGAPPFYPYLANPATWPQPEPARTLPSGYTVSGASLVSSVDDQVPTFGLLDLEHNSTNASLIYQGGIYDPTMAQAIANGSSAMPLPIEWTSETSLPVSVPAYDGDCTNGFGGGYTCETLHAYRLSAYNVISSVAPDGSRLVVADSETDKALYSYCHVVDNKNVCTYPTDTYTRVGLYQSTNYGNSWSYFGSETYSALPSQVALNYPTFLSLDEGTSQIAATTWNLTTDGPSPVTVDVPTPGLLHFAALQIPDASPKVEAFVATFGNGTIWYYVSNDGGYQWSDRLMGSFASRPASSPLNSLGDTELSNTGGSPGQVAAEAEGQSVFVMYTTYGAGAVVPAVITSGNSGQHWSAPQLTYLPDGSAQNVSLSVSPSGYVYSVWQEVGIPEPFVSEAVYSADGELIETPQMIPNSEWDSEPLTSAPSIAVDTFQRPMVVWGSRISSGGTSNVLASAGFLTPVNSLLSQQTDANSLVSGDFASGGVGSFVTSLDNNITSAIGLLGGSHPNVCGTQTLVLSEVEHVDTHEGLNYTNDTGTVCASSKSVSLAEVPLSPVVRPTGFFPDNRMSANTYLDVGDAWIDESLGVEVNVSADALPSTPPGTPPLITSLPTFSTAWSNGRLTVTPQPWSPIAAKLDIDAAYASSFTKGSPDDCSGSSNYTAYGYIHPKNESVEVDGSSQSQYIFNGNLSNVYLTNLTAGSAHSFSVTVTAVYNYTETEYAWYVKDGVKYCDESGVTTGTSTFGTTTAGTVVTNLELIPSETADNRTIANAPAGSPNLYANWTNTMPAVVSDYLNSSNGSIRDYDSAYLNTLEQMYFSGTLGTSYTYAVSATSYPGVWNASLLPSVSAGEQFSSAPFTTDFSCDFTLENVGLSMGKVYVSGVNSGLGTLTWWATKSGIGWVVVNESGVGFNITQSANGISYSNGSMEYVAELHGLSSFAIYNVTAISTYTGDSCLVYSVQGSTSFVTTSGFHPQVSPYPYDSVTREGGGMLLTWQMGPAISTYFKSGTLTWTNDSNKSQIVTEEIPMDSLWNLSKLTRGLNFTPIGVNSSYTAVLSLNLTYGGTQYTATSSDVNFTYLQDSSGDGLTNAEKILGWGISYRSLGGMVYGSTGSDVNSFSTNGLVGDYVEKEFDLNPNTVDTASSHMLDTWNLTFNLGSAETATLPSTGFRFYYENSTNPFTFLPGGSPTSANRNRTNLTPTPAGGINSGDGSAWASTVLWNTSMMTTFLNLPGVQAAFGSEGWLRATTGVWKGYRTITVWGKLSWGANPLATSTTNDGLADGSQPSPLENEVVQFNITSWAGTLKSANDEAAPFFTLSSGSDGTGTSYYQGYGPAEGDSGSSSVSYTGPYLVSIPIVTSSQYVYYNLSINDETSSGVTDLIIEVSSGVDLMNASVRYSLNKTEGADTLVGTYTVLRVAEASNTLLWAPPNDTTLSNLPWGLNRYTGEPDFDLLVLNLTNANSVGNIGNVSGGSDYTLHFSSGLNNILVPRVPFLSSPLGQALLNNSNGSSLSGAGVSFTPQDWSSRIQQSTTSPSNLSYIQIFSNTSQSQNSSTSTWYGGDPSDTDLEIGYESLQVQSVFWINLTNSGNWLFSSENAELKNLIGGLVLNESSGLTGNLLTVTSELGTLGLPTNVLAALANATIPNGGAYSAPIYHQSSASPSYWQGVGDWIWNSLTGVGLDLTRTISVVWNALIAGAAYIGGARLWLRHHLGLTAPHNQFASALKTIVSAMEWALNTLLQYVEQQIENLLVPVLNPVFSGNLAYANQLALDLQAGDNATTITTQSANASRFWSDFGGTVFVLGLAIAVVVEVVLAVVMGLTLGAGFLLGILIGLIFSAALLALEHKTSASIAQLSSANTLSPGSVRIVEAVTNSTNPPNKGTTSYNADMNTLAYNFGWVSSVTSDSLGWQMLWAALLDPDRNTRSLAFSAVTFAVGTVGLGVQLAAAATGSQNEKIISDVIAGVSLGLDAFQIITMPLARQPPLSYLNYCTTGLDASTFLISLGSGP
jgi:hypothetical protein